MQHPIRQAVDQLDAITRELPECDPKVRALLTSVVTIGRNLEEVAETVERQQRAIIRLTQTAARRLERAY